MRGTNQKLLRALLTCACTAWVAACKPQPFAAELLKQTERVERDFAATQNSWSAAHNGDRLQLGDGLRTGPTAQAVLALPGGGKLLVKSDTVVRFASSADRSAPAQQLEVLQGELSVETGSEELGVKTGRGVVRLTRESKIRLHADLQKLQFDVHIGRVDYTLDGAHKSAGAGARFELSVLPVSVESAPPPRAAPTPRAEARDPVTQPDAARPAVSEAAISGAEEPFAEPPGSALLTFAAGESVTVHDPAPPSDVRLTFAPCSEPAVLILERGKRELALRVRVAADGELRARVPRGSHHYRVRCATNTTASGQLTVLADTATRPLPLAPVAITADADGRRYSVSYQNRLPSVTLRWPYAPHADRYRLTLQPQAAEPFSVDTSEPSVSLESGRLGEGVHRFWFETAAKKRSETGVLQVAFDYTARTAYLTSPREGEARQAEGTRFAGGTLLGSSVQLQGAALKLDAHGRFAGTLHVAPDAAGAAVRVTHPSTGIHYYVRHLTP